MPSLSTWMIINIVAISVFIAGISASSYGLGISQNDRNSPAYQSASVFLSISVILIIVSIITLFMLVLFNTSSVTLQNLQNFKNTGAQGILNSPYGNAGQVNAQMHQLPQFGPHPQFTGVPSQGGYQAPNF